MSDAEKIRAYLEEFASIAHHEPERFGRDGCVGCSTKVCTLTRLVEKLLEGCEQTSMRRSTISESYITYAPGYEYIEAAAEEIKK